MSDKIKVLDIDIDNCTAKEAMKETMEYLKSEPVSVIEMVTVDGLMQMDELPELKENMQEFDLVLAGDKTILEAADITDRKFLQETEGHLFLKMFMRYLHKNHKRIYLLVETEEEGQEFYDYLQRYYSGLQIIGLAKVSAQNRADDMLVNAINGGEVDCIFAALSAPLQEDFIMKNRSLLDARVFIGLGKESLPVKKAGLGQSRIGQFL
ncbi:WecB/TagA/CpsF family glycosyltransferase, partial [[Clostridium] scindens]